MRLNWNNIGKGLEGIAAAKQARDLAQESARYDVTEGAYGPGLQGNIQQLEGLRAGVADPAQNSYDPQQLAAYDQAIAELTRRQGLTAADYSVASGPTNYATRQEARQAAAPMRAEGLAGVYRRYGDVDKADALEARAYEQQRALAAEERAKARESRDVEAFGLTKTKAQLDIDEAKRKDAAAKRMVSFDEWRSKNPDADFRTINAKVQELGMGVDEQYAVASKLTGIGEQEFKASQQRIQKLIKNQGLDGLLKAHKESDDLDPGSHFEVTRGKGGVVSLNRVDTATGKIIQPNVFSGTEAETTAYLNKAAMDPATIIDYTMNLEKTKASINASKAAANKDNALSARYARDEPEKGLTKKVSEMEAVLGRKLTPAEKETALGLINKPRDEKPQKVEEPGVQYKVDGKLVQTDGMGGFISVKGVLPTDRPAALKAAGVSDNNLSRVIWSNDGEAVMFNNEEYDVRNKRDMAKLNKALEDYDVLNRKIAEENRLRGNPTGPSGFLGARPTGVGPASSYGAAPGAPSIYGR